MKNPLRGIINFTFALPFILAFIIGLIPAALLDNKGQFYLIQLIFGGGIISPFSFLYT